MSVLWTLAATIALREDAPALTLEQAKAMSPAELADALLAQGYPEIIDARIGVQGIWPPPPPATLVQSPIELIAAARVSGEPGFCERTVIKILLAPVNNENGRTPAAPPRNLETWQTYRWRDRSGQNAGCGNAGSAYFSVEKGKEQRAFALIRSFADIQARARSGKRIGVKASIDDRYALNLQEFAKINEDARVEPTVEQMAVITDGTAAIKMVPLSSISSVHFGRTSWRNLLTNADLTSEDGGLVEPASIFAGGIWFADLALHRDRITAIRLLRQVPPPF